MRFEYTFEHAEAASEAFKGIVWMYTEYVARDEQRKRLNDAETAITVRGASAVHQLNGILAELPPMQTIRVKETARFGSAEVLVSYVDGADTIGVAVSGPFCPFYGLFAEYIHAHGAQLVFYID